jgi:hypothetical protein
MSMVIGIPLNAALFGYTMTPDEIEKSMLRSVDLFLHGILHSK